MADFRRFLRSNPQVLALLLICLVLGLGMFIIVLFGIASSGNTTTTGVPSGVVTPVALGISALL